MTHSYPTLRDLATRAVLVNGIPWQEEDKGLPMVKEMEALERLPGDYIITKSSTEVAKAGGGTLSPGEAGFVEQWKKPLSLKNGGKISISKEMGGDPVVLWGIVADTESGRTWETEILGQPVQHGCEVGREGKMFAWKRTNLISGFKVANEDSYTAKVEDTLEDTLEGKLVTSNSFCLELDSKGKMEYVRKALVKFPTAELEVINKVVAEVMGKPSL